MFDVFCPSEEGIVEGAYYLFLPLGEFGRGWCSTLCIYGGVDGDCGVWVCVIVLESESGADVVGAHSYIEI